MSRVKVGPSFGKLTRALSVASGLFVLAIIVIITIDIVGRVTMNAPLPGSTVLSTLLLVCVIFLGLANVQRVKENYRVDLVANLFPAGARRVIDVFANLVSVIIVALLTNYSFWQAVGSFKQKEASYDLIAFPIWPTRMVLALGLVLLTIQLAIDFVQGVRDLIAGRDAPTAPAEGIH